jgi:hypothetical protein
MDVDNGLSAAIDMALAMYTNEPCRICGRNIEREDVGGLIFTGYSKDNTSRAAHGRCYQGFMELCGAMGYDVSQPME